MATQVLPKKEGGGGVLESHGNTAAVEAKKTPDISFSINVSRKVCNLETLSFPSLPIPSNLSLNIHWNKEVSGIWSTYYSDQQHISNVKQAARLAAKPRD